MQMVKLWNCQRTSVGQGHARLSRSSAHVVTTVQLTRPHLSKDMIGSSPTLNLVPPNGLNVTSNVSPKHTLGLGGGQSGSPSTTGHLISHAVAVIRCGCAPVSQT